MVDIGRAELDKTVFQRKKIGAFKASRQIKRITDKKQTIGRLRRGRHTVEAAAPPAPPAPPAPHGDDSRRPGDEGQTAAAASLGRVPRRHTESLSLFHGVFMKELPQLLFYNNGGRKFMTIFL